MRLVNAIVTLMPRAPQRNESFWQMIFPFHCLRSTGRILPGNGEAKATLRRIVDWLPNSVTKNESPDTSRLPPASSLLKKEPPSPVMSSVVAMRMPSCMNIIAPASATTASPGSSVMMTPCRSSPMIS